MHAIQAFIVNAKEKQMRMVLAVLLLCSLGCEDGPKLGSVTGLITLEGEPLANATITFTPADGWSAFDRTGPDGQYELQFQDGRKGAMVGENEVRIETAHIAAGGVTHPEILPKKYHEESDIVKDVQPGKQEINFELMKR